jgi:hypothetical protein
VDVREIADLLAWTRRLSEVRHHADPAEFLAAKTTLFARLAHHHDANDHTDEPATKDTR